LGDSGHGALEPHQSTSRETHQSVKRSREQLERLDTLQKYELILVKMFNLNAEGPFINKVYPVLPLVSLSYVGEISDQRHIKTLPNMFITLTYVQLDL